MNMEKIKVLVVVDMQKDFIDGALGTPEAQKIVPLVAETIHQFADPNTAIIFTKDTHPVDYMKTQEGKYLPVPHCIEGTGGAGIVDEVFEAWINHAQGENRFMSGYDAYPAYDENPIRIKKPTFGSIELQNVLYDMNDRFEIEEINFMGVLHVRASDALGGHFAKHPSHRIGNIRFSASVRADDHGNTLIEGQNRFVGEGFESLHFKSFKPQCNVLLIENINTRVKRANNTPIILYNNKLL